ncbi:GNAT family N-acetyltransferase [Planobispora siamensis]|uniref:N-acetyltransferase domain-containing protein n=1 Tax=Planobispora siamensis TaxID=936338 RepID=A0A8J3WHG2_9ACTN|nr:GNAT family N-acetyltransferase [Planobispora siamensis]GIH89508.1 hypothetical protein Psi01_01380 [Planobispora siamensis]
MEIRQSPLESARFGRPVERLTVPAGERPGFSRVREALLESAADVVVLRYPAEYVDWFAMLSLPGRIPLFAGSLTYWNLAAGRGRGPQAEEGLWTAELDDPAAVSALVAEIFAEYGNHYAANPLFDDSRALAGYQEWAGASAAGGRCLALWGRGPGGEPEVLGLATVDDGPGTEILLAGVVPAARGRGRYAHLLRAVEERALGRGSAEVVISTQEHNTRVQRAWARYGFRPSHAVLTVHLVRSGLL